MPLFVLLPEGGRSASEVMAIDLYSSVSRKYRCVGTGNKDNHFLTIAVHRVVVEEDDDEKKRLLTKIGRGN